MDLNLICCVSGFCWPISLARKLKENFSALTFFPLEPQEQCFHWLFFFFFKVAIIIFSWVYFLILLLLVLRRVVAYFFRLAEHALLNKATVCLTMRKAFDFLLPHPLLWQQKKKRQSRTTHSGIIIHACQHILVLHSHSFFNDCLNKGFFFSFSFFLTQNEYCFLKQMRSFLD